jgi:hypothetical protein
MASLIAAALISLDYILLVGGHVCLPVLESCIKLKNTKTSSKLTHFLHLKLISIRFTHITMNTTLLHMKNANKHIFTVLQELIHFIVY